MRPSRYCGKAAGERGPLSLGIGTLQEPSVTQFEDCLVVTFCLDRTGKDVVWQLHDRDIDLKIWRRHTAPNVENGAKITAIPFSDLAGMQSKFGDSR